MAGLTTEQMLLLNNLMYLPTVKQGDTTLIPPIHKQPDDCWTVGDIISNIRENFDAIEDSKDYGSFMTGEDWKNTVVAIENDSTLMNVQLMDTHKEPEGGGVSAVFVEPGSNEAAVVFCGTAAGEWKDNFIGGGPTDAADGVSAPYQENALEWYESLDLSGYDMVTVSGHSKGGNKAKYITLMDDSVDRCLSFDGQGFSDEFMAEYADAISMRQHKIENHNVDNDYVNLLLNDVGESHFYQGHDTGLNPLEFHCPNTFFKFGEDGGVSLVPGERSAIMAVTDEFLNSCLRSLSPAEKVDMLVLFGELADCALGGGEFSMEDLMTILMQPESTESMGYFLAYLMEYPQAQVMDGIKDFFTGIGMGPFAMVVDCVNELRSMDWVNFIIEHVAKGGAWALELIPDALLEWIADKLGLDLTGVKDIAVWILQLAGEVFESKQDIKVAPDSGADIALPSLGGEPVQFMVYVDALLAAADKLNSAATLLSESAERVDEQRRQISLFLAIIRLRMRDKVRKLERQQDKAKVLAKALRGFAEHYQKAEKAVCALTQQG